MPRKWKRPGEIMIVGVVRPGLEEEARKCGCELLITTGEFDSACQANQVDEFVVQRVDAIVFCPCDSHSVGASNVQANEAGIPVFAADIAGVSRLGKVATHIAVRTSSRSGGSRSGLPAGLLTKPGSTRYTTLSGLRHATRKATG